MRCLPLRHVAATLTKIAIEKLPPWCLHLCISCPDPAVCTWEKGWRREKVREFDRWQKMGIVPQKIPNVRSTLCSRAPRSAGINCIFPLYCSTPRGYNIQNPLLWTSWRETVHPLHLVTKYINPPFTWIHTTSLVLRYIWHMSIDVEYYTYLWTMSVSTNHLSRGDSCLLSEGDRGTVVYKS